MINLLDPIGLFGGDNDPQSAPQLPDPLGLLPRLPQPPNPLSLFGGLPNAAPQAAPAAPATAGQTLGMMGPTGFVPFDQLNQDGFANAAVAPVSLPDGGAPVAVNSAAPVGTVPASAL